MGLKIIGFQDIVVVD